MDAKDFMDILHELIVVETDDGLVKETSIEGNSIMVKLSDGSGFLVNIEKS